MVRCWDDTKNLPWSWWWVAERVWEISWPVSGVDERVESWRSWTIAPPAAAAHSSVSAPGVPTSVCRQALSLHTPPATWHTTLEELRLFVYENCCKSILGLWTLDEEFSWQHPLQSIMILHYNLQLFKILYSNDSSQPTGILGIFKFCLKMWSMVDHRWKNYIAMNFTTWRQHYYSVMTLSFMNREGIWKIHIDQAR